MDNIEIEVMRPAEENFPIEPYRLAFFTNPLIPAGSEITIIELPNDKSYFSNYNNYDLENYIFNLSHIINDGPKYQMASDTGILLNLYSDDTLDWSLVNDLCYNLEVDGIIFIKNFSSEVRIYESLMFGYPYYVPIYKYAYIYYPKVTLEFIDAYNHKIEDVSSFRLYEKWEEVLEFDQNVPEFFNKFDDLFNEYLYNLAMQYAEKITPGWKLENRLFYSTGNTDFIKAAKYVRDENWEQAKQIWESYKNSKKWAHSNYAYYNLALAYEMEGNLEKALEYASYTVLNYNNYYAKNYVKLLRERILDQERIKKQLGE